MSQKAPKPDSPQRLHDLDALRAFAMLLGIVLHGFLSFIPTGIWPAEDLHLPEWKTPSFLIGEGIGAPETFNPFVLLLHFIHGFRMQLFFLVSGFFTVLLWKKRGLGALLKNRVLRILVPLVICTPIILVAMIGGSAVGEKSKKAIHEMRPEKPEMGMAPLMWAANSGELETVRKLIESGENPNFTDNEKNTPLHAASFFAYPEIVELLIENGADVSAGNARGETPLDTTKHGFEIANMIGNLIGVKVERENFDERRERIHSMLSERGAASGDKSVVDSLIEVWAFLAFLIPIFNHLWFLHYLIWLVAVFLIFAWIFQKAGRKIPRAPIWALLPLPIFAQYFMGTSFGPDTAPGIVLWPPKFIYYLLFFLVGALFYGRPGFGERLKKIWSVLIGVGILTYFVALFFYGKRHDAAALNWGYSVVVVVFAWLMIFGMIGLFRRFFPGENKRIRYVSDASYWLYVAHLPLVLFIQIFIAKWDLPVLLKFLIVCGLTIGILLVLYEYVVRYTIIGTMFNGKKVHTKQ